MSKKHKFSTSDPEQLALQLMEISARKDLTNFLRLFRKDFASKLDLTKGYELHDEELPHYVPPAQLSQPNTFTLFVKATLKTDQPCRFILHTIWLGDLKMAVGIAEVPEEISTGASLNWN